MKKNQILKQELINGIMHTILKPVKLPKQITAKAPGSIKHCGRTNCFGLSV